MKTADSYVVKNPHKVEAHKKTPGHYDRVKERTMSGKVKARIQKLMDRGVKPIKIILYCNLCPGDANVLSGSLECLHRQYPGQFLTDVDTFSQSIYDNNPWITRLEMDDPEVVHLWTTYPLVNKSCQTPVHFLEGYTDWIGEQLGLRIRLEINRPYLYLSKDEEKGIGLPEEYKDYKGVALVLTTNWKNDYPVKRWPAHYMQDVVDYFKGRLIFAQVGLDRPPNHNSIPLNNVINLVGKTDLRQLILTCYHSQGGVGPVTSILHIFSSFQKPYVSIAGSREPPSFTQYPLQRTLSNVGTLECCKYSPCWTSRIIPLGDGDKKDKRLCHMPMVDEDDHAVAKCMWNIKPVHVIEAFEAWIDGGIIKTL